MAHTTPNMALAGVPDSDADPFDQFVLGVIFDRIDTLWTANGPGAVARIADTTLGSDAASIDLTSIPATFKHLLLEYSVRASFVGEKDALRMRLNGDAGANYWFHGGRVQAGALAAAGAYDYTQLVARTGTMVGEAPGTTAVANVFAAGTILIPNYAEAVHKKLVKAECGCPRVTASTGDATSDGQWTGWNDALTAAVNQLTLYMDGGSNLKAGSRITLYGMG